MDVSQYRALFIDEGREHVQRMSTLLLDIEKSPDPSAILEDLFREAHSFKGMAASMGYDPIVAVTHRLEDAFGTLLGNHPEAQVVDLFLQVIDALGAQVERIAKGEALEQGGEWVQKLVQIVPSSPQAGVRDQPPAHNWDILVTLAEDTAAPQVRAFLVHRKVSEIGRLLHAHPTEEAIRAGQVPGRELSFVVQSSVEPQAIQHTLAQITDVTTVAVTEVESVERERETLPEVSLGAETRSSTVRVNTVVLDDLIDSVGELFLAREKLRALLGHDGPADVMSALDSLESGIDRLHQQVLSVRMMPLRTLTDKYPRLVRDLSRELAKDVDFAAEGSDIELDRAILEQLDAALVHLLRNAVDHGQESPAERTACGKSPLGHIVVRASRDRDTVLLSVSDDGRGIDTARLREQAVERGLMSPAQAKALTEQEALLLICSPGFSTKEHITDISGRGVGMDVVKTDIETLGGTLDIESTLGEGSTITLRIPLTLAIIPVLIVESAQRVFAVPAVRVLAVKEANKEYRVKDHDRTFLDFDKGLVPIHSLSQVMGLSDLPLDGQYVVLQDARERVALGVGRVASYQDVVVKPLGEPLERLGWFSGATVLGSGRPVLILDVPRALRGLAA